MTAKSKKRRPTTGKRAAGTEEEIYAHYLRVQSYTRTAKHFGAPLSTVFSMVQRLGGDALAETRNAMRADLARKAMAKIGALFTAIDPAEMGSKSSSRSFEAARAADALMRVATALTPRDKGDLPPTEIHIHTGMQPPPELAEGSASADPAAPVEQPTEGEPDPAL